MFQKLKRSFCRLKKRPGECGLLVNHPISPTICHSKSCTTSAQTDHFCASSVMLLQHLWMTENSLLNLFSQQFPSFSTISTTFSDWNAWMRWPQWPRLAPLAFLATASGFVAEHQWPAGAGGGSVAGNPATRDPKNGFLHRWLRGKNDQFFWLTPKQHDCDFRENKVFLLGCHSFRHARAHLHTHRHMGTHTHTVCIWGIWSRKTVFPALADHQPKQEGSTVTKKRWVFVYHYRQRSWWSWPLKKVRFKIFKQQFNNSMG